MHAPAAAFELAQVLRTKRCRLCGRSWTVAEWCALPLVGRASYDDPTEILEYRNCDGRDCKATLVIALPQEST